MTGFVGKGARCEEGRKEGKKKRKERRKFRGRAEEIA